LFPPHPAQREVISQAALYNVLSNGRRWGKTVLGIDRATPFLVEGYPVAWYAPTYKILNDAWRDVKVAWQPVIARKNEQEKRIETISGGSIDFWSLEDPDASRGRKYAQAIVDEAAHARHLEYAWENVIGPALLDYGGGAWFFSTPDGKNYFYKLYQRGQDPLYPDWASWSFPTSSNPYINPEFIEQMRRELPERVFRQEYLGEFIEGAGAVFRKIREALYDPDPRAHKNHNIYIGVDWGKHQDFTAISVFCGNCNAEIAHDRFNQIDYIIQRDRLRAIAQHYGAQLLLVERNAAEANVEMLQADGLPVQAFDTTATSKPLLVRNLATALEKGEVRLIDAPVWTAELEAFEQKVNPNTGRSTYAAPEGMHDDTVIARCLAWEAATSGGVTVELI